MTTVSAKSGFGNTASGSLNKKQNELKCKQINLDDFDIEMISPQFLLAKTLKKEIKDLPISLQKTNPNGIQSLSKKYHQNSPSKQLSSPVIFKQHQQKKLVTKVTQLSCSLLNIKPAYKSVEKSSISSVVPKNDNFMLQKDSFTIMAAFKKKYEHQKLTFDTKPNEYEMKNQIKNITAGPAEQRLKTLFSKKEINTKKSNENVFKKKVERQEEINEQINESIEQEYEKESFEKLSAAYESAIRQSIAGESHAIKESIRESIKQSIAGSSTGKIRESIREDIKESIREDIRESMINSSKSKEDIIEEIYASKSKSKEVIEEEVYQDAFEDQSLENSLSKSQNKFKKSFNNIKQSDSVSKSFRLKNVNMGKSQRFADQFKNKEDQKFTIIKIKDESLNYEKDHIQKLKEKINKILQKKNTSEKDRKQNKNTDLLLNFKIQINKLIGSQNFESKLKKLTSFLRIDEDINSSLKNVNELEDNILKNVLKEIENIKINKSIEENDLKQLKQQYDDKLQKQLKIQEINLRAEMNQKLSNKQFELKKMIAELESRMVGRRVVSRQSFDVNNGILNNNSSNLELESDYSIDSENISWKMDLWELLPEYEKKKLYQKQANQVTKFLTTQMINQIKEEALDRSLDISFEFPDSSQDHLPKFHQTNFHQTNFHQPNFHQPNNKSDEDYSMPKAAFNRKEFQEKSQKTDYLANLPSFNSKKPSIQLSNNMNQYSKDDSDTHIQKIKREERLRPEIIKILSEYKKVYVNKKIEIIKKIIKVLQSKDEKSEKWSNSLIEEIFILSEKQYNKNHQLYIKAYEQNLIWGLVQLYNKNFHRKITVIEEEMKKKYERLLVTCQVETAQKCIEKVALDAYQAQDLNQALSNVLTKERIRILETLPCPIEIPPNQQYINLKNNREEQKIQKQLVEIITNILALEFAKEFPKKNK